MTGPGPAAGRRSDLLAALPLALLPPLLLLVTHPAWPSYEQARLALAALAAPLALLLLLPAGRLPARGRWGLLLLAAGVLLSGTAQEESRAWLLSAGYQLALFALFLAGAALPRRIAVGKVLAPWALAGAAAALVGFLQAAGADPLGVTVPHEPGSFLGNRNAAAETAMVLAPLLAGAGLAAEKKGTAALLLLAAAALVLYAGLTRTTAGLVAAGAVILCALLAAGGRNRRALFRTAVAAAVLLLLWGSGRLASPPPPPAPAGPAAAATRTEGKEWLPPTWRVRLHLWKATLGLWLDHPLRGCGAGCFVREFPPYRKQEEIRLSSRGHRVETRVSRAHSDPLHLLAETGPLGLLGYLLLLLPLLAHGLRRGRESLPAAGLACALAAFLAHGLFRAPLLNAPAAAFAFGAMGLLARPAADPAPGGGGKGRLLLALLLLLSLAPAWAGFKATLASWRAASFLAGGKREPARLDAALAADPADPDLLLLRIQARHRDPAAAKQVGADLKRYLEELRPHNHQALRLAAEWLWGGARGEATRLRRALELCRRALTLDRMHPRALVLEGMILMDLDRWEEALRSWRRVKESRPEGLLELSRKLADQGRERTSCLLLEAHLAGDYGAPGAWRRLALRWRALGYHNRFRRCLGRAHRSWALAALGQGDWERAALQTRLFRRQADAGAPAPRILQAVIDMEAGRLDECRALGEELLGEKADLVPDDLAGLEPWLPRLVRIEPWGKVVPGPGLKE